MKDSHGTVIVEYKNQQPVELLTLTKSLSAFGEEFKRFILDVPEAPSELRLYVDEMRPGSIIAELIPALEHIDFLLQNKEILAGFMTHWEDVLRLILGLKPKAKKLSPPTLRAARDFVQPIAKDGSSQLNVFHNDNRQTIYQFNFSSSESSAIAHNAEHILAHQLPAEDRFENEPMVLYQMRDAPSGTTGDKGIIDRFSNSPIKLTFGSEETKHAILHHEANPFDHIFFVDGVVKTAGGKIAAFHIRSLRSSEPKL